MKFNGGEKFRKIVASAALLGGGLFAGDEASAQGKAPSTTPVATEKSAGEFPVRAVITNPTELAKALDAGVVIKERKQSEKQEKPETSTEKAQRISQLYSEAYKAYDKQIDWVGDNMHSPEYKRRMIEHEGMTEADHEKRKELFGAVKDIYSVEDDVSTSYKEHTLSEDQTFNKDFYAGVTGYTMPQTGEIHLSVSRYRKHADGVHEAKHSSTRNGALLSSYARNLYTRSFQPQRAFSADNLEYLKDPDERNARKGELEYDMERLGIKKYEEKFSGEHYNKLMEAKKKGLLSQGSVEFLDTTNPLYLDRILHTIAAAETASDTTEDIA